MSSRVPQRPGKFWHRAQEMWPTECHSSHSESWRRAPAAIRLARHPSTASVSRVWSMRRAISRPDQPFGASERSTFPLSRREECFPGSCQKQLLNRSGYAVVGAGEGFDQTPVLQQLPHGSEKFRCQMRRGAVDLARLVLAARR